MGVIVFLTRAEEPTGESNDDNQLPILGAQTEFTYSDGPVVEDRFLAWLDAALLVALEEWQARI
jgi:hypothetical protein